MTLAEPTSKIKNMKRKDDDQPVTRKDLRDDLRTSRKDMIKDIEAMFSTFAELIFERFDLQDKEIAKLTADHVRMENKLDATITQADDHEGRITKLEPQPA